MNECRSWRAARARNRTGHAAIRCSPPGCGTTVAGRSPGSRITAFRRLPDGWPPVACV